jgi:alkanesulfonate monooxygenase SsuD/methylene tetrahydromethanopterin reductase-like flavin-dependent oxidoreductase (luciferase family)
MTATFHFMSGGRFILGISAGGPEAEHLAYGYGFGCGSARVIALDEALHVINAMWTVIQPDHIIIWNCRYLH